MHLMSIEEYCGYMPRLCYLRLHSANRGQELIAAKMAKSRRKVREEIGSPD